MRTFTSAAALAATAFVVVTLVGCGHVETHEAMLHPQVPRPGHPVELYMFDQPLPSRPFTEVAIVQAVASGNKAEPEQLAEALSARAAELGCDAVVRTAIDLGYGRAHASGVCVTFTGPGPAAPPAVLPQRSRTQAPPPNAAPTLAPRWEPLPSSSPGQGGAR
jgi:hypothetical protein